MPSSYLVVEGTLVENATSHVAIIDADTLSTAAGGSPSRLDPRMFDIHIQITDIGAAAGVTVEGMGAGNVYSTIATSKTASSASNFVNVTGVWKAVKLTWTGGTPDGAGRASFFATRKFNGV